MSLARWQAEGRLRPHIATRSEIRNMLDVAERDLSDASVQGISTDRRFLIAYDAVLALASIPLYCFGLETHGHGHHWLTFRTLPHVMGEGLTGLADYFDLCRTKRNVGTYDRGGLISRTEANELYEEARGFHRLVQDWIKANHPDLI